MSTKDPNMKVIFGSDTKDFEKGAKAVKQGLKDLDKSSESMLSGLSNAFGVPSQKVDQMTSAVRGLGYRLVETGNEGAKAFGSLLASIGPLQAGIAGLGIAGAIAGFKQLKAEAENFKSTIDGMNMSMATSAYISTYKQVLHDVNSDTGKAVAQAMDQWERGVGRFRANIGAAFVSSVSDSRWYDAILPTGIIRGWKQATANADQAEAAAARNAERASQMADLMKEQLVLNNEIKVIDRDIAEYRRLATDKSATAAERSAAEAAYREKVNEKYDKQIGLQQKMYSLQVAMDDEAANSFDDTKKTLEMEGQLIDLETARQNELRTVDKLSNSIASSTAATAAAAKKAREEAAQMAAVYAKWSGMGSVSTAGLSSLQGNVITPSLNVLPQRQDVEYFKETFQAYLGDWQLSVGFKADTEQIHDLTNQVTSLMESSIQRTGELIGNLVGTLAAGGDAWGDFKSAALSAFGDMAIAVGKIAISMGVAAAGIDVALKDTGQWYIAVAAGAALVALGSAVKSSLSAVASGDYSAGGGGYSGGYSSAGSNGGGYETRDVKVYMTGTLEADGDKLIAVINNTNNRNYYTK